jgi:hypothetical protein
MRYEAFSFGSIRIDGVTYDHDVVIDRGEVRKRKKKPSNKFRDQFGHTPLSVEEKIPWKCRPNPFSGAAARTNIRIIHEHRSCSRAGGVGGGGCAAGVVGPFECAQPAGLRFTKSRVTQPVAQPPPPMTGPARLAPNARE